MFILTNTRRFLGIFGMIITVLGGASWFYQYHIPAILCWSIAGLILFKLNKRKKKGR